VTPIDEPAGSDDDLDRWLQEMAGRQPPSSDATRALRDVVARRADLNAKSVLGAAGEPEAQQRASARLRQELQAITRSESESKAQADRPSPSLPATVRPPSGPAANDRRWRLVAGLGVLFVAAGMLWQLRPADDGEFVVASGGAPVWRAMRDPLTLPVTHPVRAAQDLAKQVAPFDTRPLLYRQAGTIIVDFDVQPGRVDEVVTGVADPRIKAALQAGSNRVVFSQAP